MTNDEVLALAEQIADKHEGTIGVGNGDTVREALVGAAIDGLLCGSSPGFRAAWT